MTNEYDIDTHPDMSSSTWEETANVQFEIDMPPRRVDGYFSDEDDGYEGEFVLHNDRRFSVEPIAPSPKPKLKKSSSSSGPLKLATLFKKRSKKGRGFSVSSSRGTLSPIPGEAPLTPKSSPEASPPPESDVARRRRLAYEEKRRHIEQTKIRLQKEKEAQREKRFGFQDVEKDDEAHANDEEQQRIIRRHASSLVSEDEDAKLPTLGEIMKMEEEKRAKKRAEEKEVERLRCASSQSEPISPSHRRPPSATKWVAAPQLSGVISEAEKYNQAIEELRQRRAENAEARKYCTELMAARKSEDGAVKAVACAKLKGTRVCNHAYDITTGRFDARKCSRGARCGFAHSKAQHVEALLGTLCAWDFGRCSCRKGSKCFWLHSIEDSAVQGGFRKETATEYTERTGMLLGELPHEKKARKARQAAAAAAVKNIKGGPSSVPGLGTPLARKVRPQVSFSSAVRSSPVPVLSQTWTRVRSNSAKLKKFKQRQALIHEKILKPFCEIHLVLVTSLEDAAEDEANPPAYAPSAPPAATPVAPPPLPVAVAAPRPSAPPSAKSAALPTNLLGTLTQYRLEAFAEVLADLGVTDLADLEFVEQEDAEELGMSKIQMRKLLKIQSLID